MYFGRDEPRTIPGTNCSSTFRPGCAPAGVRACLLYTSCRAQVGVFEADLETRNNHPLPSEGFVGMEVLGHTFSDKEEAGKAILEAVKTVVDMKSVRIGHYRGFEMSLELSSFGREYILTLRGRMAHFTTLGSDPRGNIQRIDNTLGSMESRLKTVQDQIATLQKEQEAAKEAIAKPFAQEDEPVSYTHLDVYKRQLPCRGYCLSG